MNNTDYILIAAVAGLIVFAVIVAIVNFRRGRKYGCSGDCQNCHRKKCAEMEMYDFKEKDREYTE